MLERFKKIFSRKSTLYHEALEAYSNRLPEKIEVKWFRDGKFIIGDIKADDHHFKTQGISVDDFIEMVNDSVYTMYNIPKDYLEVLSENKSYEPDPNALAGLNNLGVKRSEIKLMKQEIKPVSV